MKECGVPIVGHNLFGDLVHIYRVKPQIAIPHLSLLTGNADFCRTLTGDSRKICSHGARRFPSVSSLSIARVFQAVLTPSQRVCDTKYIATCEGTVSGVASNLQTLVETFRCIRNPTIGMCIPGHRLNVLLSRYILQNSMWITKQETVSTTTRALTVSTLPKSC